MCFSDVPVVYLPGGAGGIGDSITYRRIANAMTRTAATTHVFQSRNMAHHVGAIFKPMSTDSILPSHPWQGNSELNSRYVDRFRVMLTLASIRWKCKRPTYAQSFSMQTSAHEHFFGIIRANSFSACGFSLGGGFRSAMRGRKVQGDTWWLGRGLDSLRPQVCRSNWPWIFSCASFVVARELIEALKICMQRSHTPIAGVALSHFTILSCRSAIHISSQ